MKTRTTLAALGVLAVLGEAGCSGSAPHHAAHPASHPGTAASPVTVPYGVAGQVCAALNSLTFSGESRAAARATASSAFRLTPAQVSKAIAERCPGH